MSAKDKRKEQRDSHKIRFSPLSCSIVLKNVAVELKIINYHYRGACFKIDKSKEHLVNSNAKLIFKIGNKQIKTKYNFEVCWNNIKTNGQFGVKFSTETSFLLKRAERFDSHKINHPNISSRDPLDPNRTVYFKVENISKDGLLLKTSLTNKHLLPGMIINNGVIQIAGMGESSIDFYIENSRTSSEDSSVFFGISVMHSQTNKAYQDLISKYISSLSSIKDENLDRVKVIQDEGFIHKNIRKNLTIKEISNVKDYEKTLKLRFQSYKKADKVGKNFSWKNMGPGLDKEGTIIGAYLGAQLVASCEFRLNSNLKLNIENKFNLSSLPFYRKKAYAEINKLSVHPSIQTSDVVLGIFQKVHALATFNNNPDGIIQAEEKLKPLYKKLGFKDTGLTVPHEYLKGLNLSIMIIQSETYEISEGMNPYAWSVAFEDSQRYFKSIGISKNKNLSIFQLAIKKISSLYFVFNKKYHRKNKNKNFEGGPKTVKCFAAAKYTKQHLNATILLSYLLEIKDFAGEKWINDLLNEYKFKWDYFRSTSNWVSVLFFDELIQRFSEVGDPYLLNKNAGYRATKKEILGVNYFIIKHFLNPSVAFKALETYLPKFNKTRTYKLIESTWSSSRIRILNNSTELIPKDPAAKVHWEALLDAYVILATGKTAKIETISSTFDGDEYCEYNVQWENSFFKSQHFLISLPILALATLATVSIKHFLGFQNINILLLIPSIFFPLYFYNHSIKYKKMHIEVLRSHNKFEEEVDKKYQELHTAKSVIESDYQTSKILEKINFKIQNSISINDILNSSLAMACEKLDFSRAFIMLIDEDKKFLRTASIYSKTETNHLLWDYKVDVTKKREKNIFLSSVFINSQSIIIDNIDDHINNLNDQSKILIKALKTNGFTMMPIPGESGNWGVLIADKTDKLNRLNRRDLVSLQRVAQSIGISLDKNRIIEEEKLIRNSFQKYVPSAIVDNILGQQGILMGSSNKEVICLFMDIRDFTKISSIIPPTQLIETLNSIYQILEDEIKPTGGVIDKYLGDGALVTWGSIPGSAPNCKEAIKSAFNFLDKINNFNKKMVEHGLPNINIGLGMHKGNVLAGNIGSNNKKEFTVIGSSVNLASRLEQLNKVYNSNLVVSEEIFCNLDNKNLWRVHNSIQIRGYSQPLNIAVLKEGNDE